MSPVLVIEREDTMTKIKKGCNSYSTFQDLQSYTDPIEFNTFQDPLLITTDNLKRIQRTKDAGMFRYSTEAEKEPRLKHGKIQ